jgi:hypothetical protein
VSRKLRIRGEHLFAEGKNGHGLGRARSRGVIRIQTQISLTGIVQNLKRLSKYVSRRRRGAGVVALNRAPRLWRSILPQLSAR